MQYLAWRVLAGLNKKIEISFMMVGHTKFAPDWAFGLLKQKFRKTVVGCLEDLVNVVNRSASVNVAQLVGKEDGTTFVRQYNWSDYFNTYYKRQAFDGIKAFHHLVFEENKPGQVIVRHVSDGEETVLNILTKAHLQWKPDCNELPNEIKPPGLSHERQSYLFDKIREFCPEEHKDIVCPNPNNSRLTSVEPCQVISQPSLNLTLSQPSETHLSSTPPSKRQCYRR